MPPSPCGEETDIVIEFADPAPAQLGAAARQALQDIQNKQRDTQHRVLDLVRPSHCCVVLPCLASGSCAADWVGKLNSASREEPHAAPLNEL